MIRLQLTSIDIEEVLCSVSTPAAGAIDVFVGTTRNHADGKSVKALDYEAYEAMALKEMEKIEKEAGDRWKVENIAIVHRLGCVEVGASSVVIAVAAAHRQEAFDACRFIIDTLKERVPIWKREEFSDGSIEWSRHKHEQRNRQFHP